MAEYVGRTVWKAFPGYEEPFHGTITDYDEAAQFWSVKYDDGDQEDLSEDELQAVLEEPAEAGPSGARAQAKKRGRKKLLQPQRTRRATAQALAPVAAPSSEAGKSKRVLRSPASAATGRHAKKQKQDSKKHRPNGGKLEKRFSFGEEAARTLTIMSGRSGQAALDTATSNDIIDSGSRPAAPPPGKSRKTRSLQALSGPTAAMGAEMQSAEGGQQTSRPRGRPRKHPLPISKQPGDAVASEKKQEDSLNHDGSGADEFFITLEKSAIVEDEAAETGSKAEPAVKQGHNVAADRDDWGAREKAVPPGSPAAAAIQRKEEKLASPKKASGVSGGAKAPTIRRGAPTSGPLEGPTRFHNHVVYNGVAYIAGQTAKDHSVQDYAAQTKQVLQALDAQLKAAGSSRNNILKANVLLKDIALGAEVFNAIWEKWIDPKHAPARMTFEASLIHPELLVEVDAIAAVPADQI